MGKERRLYKRVYFSRKDEIKIKFYFKGSTGGASEALLMNLSQGGVALAARKNEVEEICKGSRLKVSFIEGEPELEFLSKIELEVKWVLHNTTLKHLGFGCEFLNISPNLRNRIKIFMESWIRRKGQGYQGVKNGY